MDPTANLAEQLRIAARMVARNDKYAERHGVSNGLWPACAIVAHEADSDRLAELVLALNEWISKGGFYPAQWPAPDPRNGKTCGVCGAVFTGEERMIAYVNDDSADYYCEAHAPRMC